MDCIEKKIDNVITLENVQDAQTQLIEAQEELDSGSLQRQARDSRYRWSSAVRNLSLRKSFLAENESLIATTEAQIAALEETKEQYLAELEVLLAIPEPERTEAQVERIADLEALITMTEKDILSLQVELTSAEAYNQELAQAIEDLENEVEAELATYQDDLAQLKALQLQVEALEAAYNGLNAGYQLSQQGIQNRIDGNEEINFANVWETICAYGRTVETFTELKGQAEKSAKTGIEDLLNYDILIKRQPILFKWSEQLVSQFADNNLESGIFPFFDNVLTSEEREIFGNDVDNFVDAFEGSDPAATSLATSLSIQENLIQYPGGDQYTTQRATKDAFLKASNEYSYGNLFEVVLMDQISSEAGWNSSYLDPSDPATYPISANDAAAVRTYIENWCNTFYIPTLFGPTAEFLPVELSTLTFQNIINGTSGLPVGLQSTLQNYLNPIVGDAGTQMGLSQFMINWYEQIAELTPFWNAFPREDWDTTVRAKSDARSKQTNERDLAIPPVVGGTILTNGDVGVIGSFNYGAGGDVEDPNVAKVLAYLPTLQKGIDETSVSAANEVVVYTDVIDSIANLTEQTESIQVYIKAYVNMSTQNEGEDGVYEEAINDSSTSIANPFKCVSPGGEGYSECQLPSQTATPADMLKASRAHKWSLAEIKDELMAAVLKGECCATFSQPLKWETIRVLLTKGYNILINFTPSGIGNMITVTWNLEQPS